MQFSPSLIIAQDSSADKPLSKEALDSLEAGEEAMTLLNEMEVLMKKMTRQRSYQCLKVFGHSKFCNCINEKLAVGLSFGGYVQVLASTKEELGYSKFSEENKSLVDNALKVREECVTELGFQ